LYPNCKAELARQDITLEMLAKVLGRSLTTVSLKLNGKYPLTLREAKAIKNFLKVDMPLEELFEEAND
jgi:cyanate lyase